MWRRLILILCLAWAAASAAGPAMAQAARSLSIYGWTDYIDPQVLDGFTRETGVALVYDAYESTPALEARMAAGGASYDVIIGAVPALGRLAKAGKLREAEPARQIKARGTWPVLVERLATVDPAGRYLTPYVWGVLGLGVNSRKVKERLGEAGLTGWDQLLRPEIAGKLRDCGIQLPDAPQTMVPIVLNALKANPASQAEGDWRRAIEALMRIRRSVQEISRPDRGEALGSGMACVVVASPADIRDARARAEELRNGVEITAVLPREGAPLWIDALAIPAEARNSADAQSFIAYLQRPDIAARNAAFLGYAAPLQAAAQATPAPSRDALPYPDEAAMKRLFLLPSYEEAALKGLDRLWKRLRDSK